MPKAGHRRKTFEIYTQDRLLLNYRGAIGIKTGWTTKARGTFVGAATRGGRTLVATVMHTGFSSWSESAALLSWGFANYDRAHPVGTLDQPVPTTQAASVRHPSATGGGAVAADTTGDALPRWMWLPLLLIAAVVGLRTRVLVRRRLRRPRRLSPPRTPRAVG
jgi:D-alanyl-D-alanine carboxypeptidase (penicillin-binding protein 5/6)